MSEVFGNTSSLLQIDFDAAIAKLAWSQLQGTWQLPAELARLAISSGARTIGFDIEARHLAMTVSGGRLRHRVLSGFVSVLDLRLDAIDRHCAMVELEELGASVLSAIACSPSVSITLVMGKSDGLKVHRSTDGELQVLNPSDSAIEQEDFELIIDGLSLEANRATKWLRRTSRFASVQITIGGAQVKRGFRRAMAQAKLLVEPVDARPGKPYRPGPPLSCRVAISPGGATPRLWLLQNGVVKTHATVPGYPAFEAAIEMAPVSGKKWHEKRQGRAASVTGAALRERLSPYVEALVDASVRLMIELAATAAGKREASRSRIARLLLEAALKRRRLSEVSGVAMFPLITAEGCRLISIDIVSRLIRVEEGGGCSLEAIPPGRSPREFAFSGQGALALSQGERTLLSELLQVAFSSPPARLRQSVALRFLERIEDRLSSFRWARGNLLADSELAADERAFLACCRALAKEEEVPAIEFRVGNHRPRTTAEGLLQLPRDNRIVRACVRAVARDASWFYPAITALLSGKALPSTETRRRWFTNLETGSVALRREGLAPFSHQEVKEI